MSESNEDRKQETPADVGKDVPPSETEAPREVEAPHSRGAAGRGLSFLALLIAVGALAASVWQWHEGRGRSGVVRDELAKKISEFERYAKEAGELAREVRQLSSDTRAKVAALENRIAESQDRQSALDQIYRDLTRNRDDWAFAEVEQSLHIANRQLQLAGNAKAALAALQAADAQLQSIDRPQFTTLRKSLAHDIERLKALPQVDVVGVSARLETLMGRIDGLPLTPDVRAQPGVPAVEQQGAATVWERFWRDAWSELKQLVRVQRMEKPELPLLAPEQQFFLRENAKLRLLAARVALLGRDEESFREDLKAAHGWLERYFDAGNSGVAQAVASLKELQATKIKIEAPDISATIDLLRGLRAPREQASR